MNINACLSSNKNYWETPCDLFNELNREFNFTLDPCASDQNHKCDKFFTEKENGLLQDWSNDIVFCNPPYGRIDTGLWVKKCHEESKKTTVVMLIPSRTDTKWFHDYIYNKHEIRFLKGRLKFEINGKSMDAAPFPSMIVIMKPSDFKKEVESVIKQIERSQKLERALNRACEELASLDYRLKMHENHFVYDCDSKNEEQWKEWCMK